MKKTPVIWMLDDNPMVLNLAEFTIKNDLECQFRKFSAAEDAVLELQNEKPDLIIVDYMLSATDQLMMDGLQFLQALRQHGLKIPAIVLSGQKDKEKAAEMLRHGALDYISKDEENFTNILSSSTKSVLNFVSEREEQFTLQNKIKRNLVTAGVGILLFVIFLISVRALTA